MRTSLTHPLEIAEITPSLGYGKIGITFCPGKKQAHAATGSWNRDIDLDLDAIAAWNAAAVVTLLEKHEMAGLKVEGLGGGVIARHMLWYHFPIADGTAEVEPYPVWCLYREELVALVRDGSNILVHCKGGLGRAGMIAVELLASLGMPNDEAIAQVRDVRPGAIETRDQLVYASNRRGDPEALPGCLDDEREDRAVGAMLGLALGDALGTTLEFSRRDSQARLTEIVGGGPFKLEAGQWTDDTAMALALMASLSQEPSLDEADLMRRFVSWHQTGEYSCTGTCFDIGGTTSASLRRWQQSGNPLAGSSDPMSAGNGSLMRLAPVAIRHWRDRETLRDVAARQSRTTHGAPEAVDACIAFAEILADAIEGRPRSAIMQARGGRYTGSIAPILDGSWRGKPRNQIQSTGYVAHSLEAALWCGE